MTRRQCDDNCAGAVCRGNPNAVCLLDVNCQARFVDIQSGTVVNCDKVVGVCQRMAALRFKESLISSKLFPVVPECDEYGNYAPVQCSLDRSTCWCVEKNGQMVPDTHVNLESNQKLQCTLLTPKYIQASLKLDADFSMIKDRQQSFSDALIPQIATKMGVMSDKIRINKLSEGSIIVEYDVEVPENEEGAAETIALQEAFTQSVNEDKDFQVDYDNVKMNAVSSKYAIGYDDPDNDMTRMSSEKKKELGPGYIALIVICILLFIAVVVGMVMMCRYREKKERKQRWKQLNQMRQAEKNHKQDFVLSAPSTSSDGNSQNSDDFPPPGYDNPVYAYTAEVNTSPTQTIEEAKKPHDSNV